MKLNKMELKQKVGQKSAATNRLALKNAIRSICLDLRFSVRPNGSVTKWDEFYSETKLVEVGICFRCSGPNGNIIPLGTDTPFAVTHSKHQIQTNRSLNER